MNASIDSIVVSAVIKFVSLTPFNTSHLIFASTLIALFAFWDMFFDLRHRALVRPMSYKFRNAPEILPTEVDIALLITMIFLTIRLVLLPQIDSETMYIDPAKSIQITIPSNWTIQDSLPHYHDLRNLEFTKVSTITSNESTDHIIIGEVSGEVVIPDGYLEDDSFSNNALFTATYSNESYPLTSKKTISIIDRSNKTIVIYMDTDQTLIKRYLDTVKAI